MKMTMHIDREVLARAMRAAGVKTKTEAVNIALTELARRSNMTRLFRTGLGLSPAELRNSLRPGSLNPPAEEVFALGEKEQAAYGRRRRTR